MNGEGMTSILDLYLKKDYSGCYVEKGKKEEGTKGNKDLLGY